MRTLLLSILIICSFTISYAQFSPGPSIAGGILRRKKIVTAEQRKEAQDNLDLAYAAYSNGDLETTKKYLDESQKDGRVTEDFYVLLGQYFFDKKQYKYAKRYWTRGTEKTRCDVCEEKLKEYESLLKEE